MNGISRPTLSCRIGRHDWEHGSDVQSPVRRCSRCLKVQRGSYRPSGIIRWRTVHQYSFVYCRACRNELSSDPRQIIDYTHGHSDVYTYTCRCGVRSSFDFGLAPCPIAVDEPSSGV